MATKTFKIGLSNTDKQNMAQDVYERLLALTFPEYDSAESYNVGDFVVYNDQLYKCIGATSGAWDSTKWQLATLNDLVTDIEDAVQFVNDKANVDGNYPTLTAGLADNLTPYSEDSGAEQENPFISNGTGTNNNTEIVTVGDYALLKEKQGHTLKIIQLFDTFPTTTLNGITITNNGNGSYTLNGTASAGVIFDIIPNLQSVPSGHKLLVLGIENGSYSSVWLQGKDSADATYAIYNSKIITLTSNDFRLNCRVESGNTVSNFTIRPLVFDITEWGADVVADLTAHPENFFRYYNGSLAYNAGSLENANGVRLVSTGRNLFDEETELGSINSETGALIPTSSVIRSKNFNVCVPNKDYYIKNTSNVWVYWYDKDYNYLGYTSGGVINGVRKSPENASYFKLVINSTTYNHDTTISIYYTQEEGGEGYDQYYPYEEPYIVDTGNEVLRSAGSVKDYKEPNGTIHRLVGVVDLGSLEWSYISGDNARFVAQVSGIKEITEGSIVANILCAKYEKDTFSNVFYHSKDKIIGLASNSDSIGIYDSAYTDTATFKTAMSGVYLFYELAEPTTEQGTPFAENLPINDYGMLYWLDSSNNLVGIPQGAKIFYPVNYKGFLDDIYARTDGDAQDLVIQSDLEASEQARDTVDAQLKNALGGTLRQLLASSQNIDFLNTDFIDLGTLTWTRVASGNGFYYFECGNDNIPNMKDRNNVPMEQSIICSKYKTAPNNILYGSEQINLNVCHTRTRLLIRDDNYTSADTFKNAMKGVLLAYEKESA